MKHTSRPLGALCIAISLAGCAGPVTDVAPPAAHLMRPADPFPLVRPGDDALVVLAEAAASHNRNARKIRGLQKYIKLLRKG